MRKISSLFAGLLLVAMPALASNPVILPDWMQQAIAQPKGTYSAETNAVVLLEEKTIIVTAPDQYVERARRVVRILRPEGRNQGHFGVHIGPGDTIQNLHAWSVDASGHNFEVKQKDFSEYSLFEDVLYSDLRGMRADPSGVEVGSVVAFEYDIRRKTYKSELDWAPQEDIPVKNASLTLEVPLDFEYSFSWANRDNLKPEQLAPNKCRWSVSEIPGIEHEELRLEIGSLAQRLSIAYFGPGVTKFGDWAAIGTWYKNLASSRLASNPAIASAAHSLIANKSGFDAQVRAIASFVQSDVRYVAISIGIGGYQPHFATDIFQHRYGDCKDKATLMSAMLNELGYHSELVLVDTERDFVKPNVPSSEFDHAIIAIQLPADVPDDAYLSTVKTKSGKRYVIFDPTNEFLGFGQVPSYEQNSYVLIASDPGELVQLPLLVPQASGSENTGKFTLATDGSLSGSMVQRLRGNAASRMRLTLHEYTQSDHSRFMELVANSSKQATVENTKFENLKATDKDLLIQYDVKMPDYAQNTAGLLLVRARVFGDRALHLDTKKRKYSIELAGTRHDHDEFDIALPAGYSIDELPDNVKVDVGFASYESKIESKGNTIHYTRDYVVRDPHIGLEKLPDLKRFESAIATDQYATAILKKAQ